MEEGGTEESRVWVVERGLRCGLGLQRGASKQLLLWQETMRSHSRPAMVSKDGSKRQWSTVILVLLDTTEREV